MLMGMLSYTVHTVNLIRGATVILVRLVVPRSRTTLRKHQLSKKHRLAQDSYINKQQFMSPLKSAPIYAMHARTQQKADESTMKDLDIKLRTVYLIAKDEMSFTAFLSLVKLRKRNGLPITDSYCSDVQCAKMIAEIAAELESNLHDENVAAKYISVMAGDTGQRWYIRTISQWELHKRLRVEDSDNRGTSPVKR